MKPLNKALQLTIHSALQSTHGIFWHRTQSLRSSRGAAEALWLAAERNIRYAADTEPAANSMQISLVIFDCDGVLVDSERLINRIESAYFRELGLDLSPDDARDLFKGKQVAQVAEIVQSRTRGDIDPAWLYDLGMATADEFASNLQAVPGVQDVLRILRDRDLKFCVASQAPPARTRLALRLTGLLPFFDGTVFTSFDVSRGKPSPDLFLHAASQCGFEPSSCAVVEDSVSGVEAGISAGMRVFGYMADGEAGDLSTSGATEFCCMAELPNLLELASAA